VDFDALSRIRAQTKAIESGALISIVILSAVYEAVDVMAVSGIAGTGRNEIAILGRDYYVGLHLLQIKDLLTGSLVKNIEAP